MTGPGPVDAYLHALRDDDPELLYDTAPCGYLSTTPDGKILKANQTLLDLLGYQRDELVGRLKFTDLLSAGGRIYHETHYAPMLRMQGTAREIALDLVHHDGSRIPVLVNAVVDSAADGSVRMVRAAVFDATHRRAYEIELRAAKERAEAAEREAVLLAQILRQSLVPPSAPVVPKLDVAAVFHAADPGTQIGGDFFDVFQLGTDEWAAVLGDVCGKGTEAAVVATLTRYTIHALCVENDDPADTLRMTNRVLRHNANDRFCSAVCLRFRLVGDTWHGMLSAAGHPLPLVRRTDGTVATIGQTGTLLNIVDEPPQHATAFELHPGDLMLLCTDGVFEARRGDEFYGEARVEELLRHHEGTADEFTQALLSEVLAFHSRPTADDIAILVLRVPPA
jgi:sigma-B regulation protein RsbU (phosphoserine phosphatase)